AHTKLALNLDRPAVRLDNQLGDGQPQPGAGDRSVGRFDAVELVENARLLLWPDAHALIRHADLHAAIYPSHGYRYRAAIRRVFDRVGDEVAHDLRQPERVAERRRHAGLRLKPDRMGR